MEPVEIRLLGPVELRVGPQVIPIGPNQQRLLLAALAVDIGRTVPTEALVDRVWDEAPDTARHTLYVLIRRMRRQLEAVPGETAVELVRRGGGYLLTGSADQVDGLRLRALAERARQHGAEAALPLLREAVGLWRGEALPGLPGQWAARVRDSWRHEYVGVVVQWALAEGRCGNAPAVLGRLTELAGEQPLAESVTAALMRALALAGRPADALSEYDRIRRRLAEALGTDPGPELRQVHTSILHGRSDPVTASATGPASGPASGTAQAPASVQAPAQLPPAVGTLVGRAEQLAGLDSLLPDGDSTGPVIVVVSGPGGIGKTTLAVHWAQRVRQHFPDGQLSCDLRGFAPGGVRTEPAAVARRFLDGLGVPARRIPTDPEALAALYRTVLADRRILILLDNARDADQVRPLLAGGPAAMVVVTSRNRLAPLVAAGARSMPLELLTPQQSTQLLAQRLGEDQVSLQPETTARIVAACAGLPLALGIAAARAQSPDLPLARLDQELVGLDRLDVLDAGDAATQVRTVMSWSYRALRPDAARLLRQVGLHPAPVVPEAALLSLGGDLPHRTRAACRELSSVSLAAERDGGLVLHDLLHAYALELAEQQPRAEREAAEHRLVSHYLRTASAADRLLYPNRDTPILALPPVPEGVVRGRLESPDQAMAWFDAEQATLLALLHRSARAGLHAEAWHLAWALDTYLDRAAQWVPLVEAWRVARGAAQQLGHAAAEAYTLRAISSSRMLLDQLDEAEAELTWALRLSHTSGDRTERAYVHLCLARLRRLQEQPSDALAEAEQALALFRVTGQLRGQAMALNAVGWYHSLLSDHAAAQRCCSEALAIFQELQDRFGEANTWDSLGLAHANLGQERDSIRCYRRCVVLFQELGDRYNEADSLIALGDVELSAGERAAAAGSWSRALQLFEELDHPDAQGLRARLEQLSVTT